MGVVQGYDEEKWGKSVPLQHPSMDPEIRTLSVRRHHSCTCVPVHGLYSSEQIGRNTVGSQDLDHNAYGVPPNLLRAIETMYRDTSARVSTCSTPAWILKSSLS